jgi:hypothetical protein
VIVFFTPADALFCTSPSLLYGNRRLYSMVVADAEPSFLKTHKSLYESHIRMGKRAAVSWIFGHFDWQVL